MVAIVHEAPWKPGLFTFLLWSGHYMQLVFNSKAMIQIYILGARLIPFLKKLYCNVMFWMILKFSPLKSLLKSPSGGREQFSARVDMCWKTQSDWLFLSKEILLAETFRESRVTWQYTADNLYTCAIMEVCDIKLNSVSKRAPMFWTDHTFTRPMGCSFSTTGKAYRVITEPVYSCVLSVSWPTVHDASVHRLAYISIVVADAWCQVYLPSATRKLLI